ncbi:hypothetical protein B0H16DRAFT_1477481 [Mycena metata]|uniref:Uncharacterized protein n=1 Tax=Mycena metata TaxID=1033252 RepID=A0AAD7H9K0_9AGAR|nr:hypothetical protein B0H16DRAFT_1477481 [Mycena metata]
MKGRSLAALLKVRISRRPWAEQSRTSTIRSDQLGTAASRVWAAYLAKSATILLRGEDPADAAAAWPGEAPGEEWGQEDTMEDTMEDHQLRDGGLVISYHHHLLVMGSFPGVPPLQPRKRPSPVEKRLKHTEYTLTHLAPRGYPVTRRRTRPRTQSPTRDHKKRTVNGKTHHPSSSSYHHHLQEKILATSPRKALKTNDGVFKVDHPDRPRDSPAKRKTPLFVATDLTSLSLPKSPSSAGSSNHSPTPGARQPLPSATPSVASTPSPTTPTTELSIDIDNAQPPPPNATGGIQGQQQQQQPQQQQPQPQQQPPPQQQHQPSRPPSDEAWMAMTPWGKSNNPHRGYAPAQAAPRLLPDGNPPFQRNAGRYNKAVITTPSIFENVDEEFKNAILPAREKYIALIMFNGGQRAIIVSKNAIPELLRGLSTLVDPASIHIISPQPAVVQTGNWNRDKYLAPGIFFLRSDDPTVLAQIAAQQTLAMHRDLAVHAVRIEPSLLSLVMGLWRPVSSTLSPLVLLQHARVAFRKKFITNTTTITAVGQATQGTLTGTAAEHALCVAKSVDAQWVAHATDPLIIIYMQPPTTDHAAWEHIKVTMRGAVLVHDTFAFTPLAEDALTPPPCVVCKLDTHIAYLCPFTKGEYDPDAEPGDIVAPQ